MSFAIFPNSHSAEHSFHRGRFSTPHSFDLFDTEGSPSPAINHRPNTDASQGFVVHDMSEKTSVPLPHPSCPPGPLHLSEPPHDSHSHDFQLFPLLSPFPLPPPSHPDFQDNFQLYQSQPMHNITTIQGQYECISEGLKEEAEETGEIIVERMRTDNEYEERIGEDNGEKIRNGEGIGRGTGGQGLGAVIDEQFKSMALPSHIPSSLRPSELPRSLPSTLFIEIPEENDENYENENYGNEGNDETDETNGNDYRYDDNGFFEECNEYDKENKEKEGESGKEEKGEGEKKTKEEINKVKHEVKVEELSTSSYYSANYELHKKYDKDEKKKEKEEKQGNEGNELELLSLSPDTQTTMETVIDSCSSYTSGFSPNFVHNFPPNSSYSHFSPSSDYSNCCYSYPPNNYQFNNQYQYLNSPSSPYSPYSPSPSYSSYSPCSSTSYELFPAQGHVDAIASIPFTGGTSVPLSGVTPASADTIALTANKKTDQNKNTKKTAELEKITELDKVAEMIIYNTTDEVIGKTIEEDIKI